MAGNLGSLGSLFIDLAANTATFESDIGRAQKLADRASKDIAARFATLATAATAGFAAAGAAAGAGLKSAIDRADELSKAAVKTGTTTEAISKLAYAGRLADVALGDLSGAIQKLNKNSVEAAGGSKAQQEAFAAIGVSVRDTNGRLKDSYSLFLDTAEGLSKVEEGAKRTALAQEIFGKSGANLLPLLADGRKGLEESAAEAKAFGQIISTEAGKQAERFNDNLTRLKELATGAGNNLAADLLPSMSAVSDKLIELGKEGLLTDAREGIKQFTRQTAIGFAIAAEAVFGVLKTLRAVGGSVEVVLNDIKAVVKFPGLLASDAAKADYATFLDERAKTLREAGQRYTDLVDYNATAISDALREAFAKADAASRDAASATPVMLGGGGKGVPANVGLMQAPKARIGPMQDQQIKDFLATLQQQDQQVKDFAAAQEVQQRERERIAESLSREYGPASIGGVEGENARYAAELEAFDNSRQELIALGADYYALQAEAARAHQDELTRIELAGNEARRRSTEQSLYVAGQIVANLSSAAESAGLARSKRGFEAAKLLNIAQATISTATAISNALAVPPYPLGLALATSAGIAGAAQIAAIKSQKFGGGRRYGGNVAAGGIYEVAEPGNPELIKYGSKTILAMGSQPGTVIPAKAMSAQAAMAGGRGAGNVSIVINNTAGDLVGARARSSRGLNGDQVIELLVAELDDNAGPISRAMTRKTGMRGRGAIG